MTIANVTAGTLITEAWGNSVADILNDQNVIESGSNSNGNYVKLGSGIMVQWNYVASQSYPALSSYGVLYIGTIVSVFPVAFVSPPAVTIGQAQWGTGAGWGAAFDTTSTQFNARIYDAYARSTTTDPFSWVAIGYWS
tara:strand:- start:1964 stop:2377 length:414 start_codon:yes stop_codon:yes gene_type:complete